MKNILKSLMLMAAVFTVYSCTEAEPEVEKVNQNLAFTLKADNIEHDSARIVVSHNGDDKDTWYGFYVEGNVDENNLGTAIMKEIEDLKSGNLEESLFAERRKNVNIRHLEPSTTYTYIAVGISKTGKVYGTYNSIAFTTLREMPDFVETDNWKVSYERGTFVDPADNQEYPDTEIFNVKCDEDKYYYFDLVDKWLLDYYELTVTDYLEMIVETVEDYKAAGETAKSLLVMNANTDIPWPRQMWGDYAVFIVGYDSECNPTGEYTMFEFTITEEEAEPEYTRWLGTWNLPFTVDYQETDEEGNPKTDENGNPVMTTKTGSYEITLSHIDNNNIYVMTGWEVHGDNLSINVAEFLGLTGEYENGYPVEVYYEDGKLIFTETYLDELTNQSTGDAMPFGFYGIADILIKETNETNEDALCGWTGMTMATAESTDGENGVITGADYEDDMYVIDYTSMGLIAYSTTTYIYFNPPIGFPITMNKKNNESLTSISRMNKVEKDRYEIIKSKRLRSKTTGKPVVLAR